MEEPSERETTAEAADGGAISRRGLLRNAAVGAGAIVLSQVGIAAAQTATPTPTPLPAPGDRLRQPAIADMSTITTTPSYVLPSTQGVVIKPLLTVGDKATNGYTMVGIPDGLGAFRSGGTFTLLMNHELGNASGVVRSHGSKGAFVSQWKIDRDSLDVQEGKDFTTSASTLHVWLGNAYSTGTTAWSRFCSGDLPSPDALRYGTLGTTERIYLNGEEVTDGRAWAHIVTGPEAGHTWQLPRLGRMPFENVVASPHSKEKTVIFLLDDGNLSTAPNAANGPCELLVYIGTKQTSGSTIERAGLTNGKLYGVRIYREQKLITEESDDFGFGDATTGYVDQAGFTLVELGNAGDVSNLLQLQIEQDAIAKDIFRFQRIEDGAWDPRETRPRDFYFVTTASLTLTSRLWHVRFNDVNLPENGGRIEILLNATQGRMFDNITIDPLGRLLLQEDTGNAPHVAKIWLYGIDTGEFFEVASHDPAYFEPGGSKFITQDEESSGIIDATDVLGPGWFLFDVQVHKASTEELVEGGQLLAMYVPTQLGRNLGRRRNDTLPQ